MFARLGHAIARHWQLTLVFWGALTVALPWLAPAWDDVTNDGDFAYLPAEMSSVQAEQILQAAFDRERAKSQIAIVVFRDDAPLDEEDLQYLAYDMGRRLHNAFGVVAMARARDFASQANEAIDAEHLIQQRDRWRRRAEDSFNEAIALDSLLAYERPAVGPGSRWALPIFNRALLYERMGRGDEAQFDQQLVATLAPDLDPQQGPQPQQAEDLPWLDLWTWRDPTFGAKLRSEDDRARLMLLQLSEEFLAVANIELVQFIESELRQVQSAAADAGITHLQIGVSGSAAVGGDLLLAARESIRHTEVFTVVMVVLILAFVYRSPLLIIVPLATIFVSLRVSTALVAALTELGSVPGFSWWHLQVFTTSKIFIVVILFGAGTDFCLFLISRCRESLAAGSVGPNAVATAVEGVGEALTASAMTTVVGLAMMMFADFGKFRYSGPVIGLCLLVTLAACLTLTPALLCLVGGWLRPAQHAPSAIWKRIAAMATGRPAIVLTCTLLLFAPFAWRGIQRESQVSYDFLASLSPRAPSRVGAELMKNSFPIGESGPLMVVARTPEPVLESRVGRDEVARLNYMIHDIQGVISVRSLADPLGETQPEDATVLLSRDVIEARFARYHHRTAELYLAQSPDYLGKVTRFEVIFAHDPFSPAAINGLQLVEDALAHIADTDPFWRGSEFYVAGVTAGIRDLSVVTRSDTRRIKLLVVFAVFVVLLSILRRPLICLYLVGSVLLSYYVTVGLIDIAFTQLEPAYVGLDWKTPLFLFVILVAVGQDYNVYLVTRVFEEQRRLPRLAGLRRAVEKTGGIITSCGFIMAGTFFSMTGGYAAALLKRWTNWQWIPETQYLMGVIQLGAALSVGVLLDTLIVRTILVPAFLALAQRPTSKPEQPSDA